MPRGYRRNWFAVEVSIIDHDKWMALTWDQRGKWIAVRALAERQPTDDFKDRGYLANLLKKEGDRTPGATIDKLIEVRLLDVGDDGRVSIHDIGEWTPDKSTLRVQRLRETDRNGPKRQETAREDKSRESREIRGETSRAPATGGSGRARTDGETLKAYLLRIGAPIPFEETKNGETRTESGSDDDGKSRRRAKRGPATTG